MSVFRGTNLTEIQYMTKTSLKFRVRTHGIVVDVRQDSKWVNAISVMAVMRPGSFDVSRVGGLYPPVGNGMIKKSLTLLNFPEGDGGLDSAVVWAKDNGLKTVEPRSLFAIKTAHPGLHKKIGQGGVVLVETVGCTLNHTGFPDKRHLCCVVLGDGVPAVGLFPVNQFNGFGSHDIWFVFSD